MKPTKTFAKLFSSVSTLAGVADAMALNVVDWGIKGKFFKVMRVRPINATFLRLL